MGIAGSLQVNGERAGNPKGFARSAILA